MLSIEVTLAIAGIILVAVVATAVAVVVKAPQRARKIATLYDAWASELGLPELTDDPKLNQKAIEKFVKVIWNKAIPEELDIKFELSDLKHETLIEFTKMANELLQPKKSPFELIYDFNDAEEGYITLKSVPAKSQQYDEHATVEYITNVAKKHLELPEFFSIEVTEDAVLNSEKGVYSFIISDKSVTELDETSITKALQDFSEAFRDVWVSQRLSENAILFRKQTPEDLIVKEEAKEINPFEAKLEAKRKAQEEAEALARAKEEERRAIWAAAEAKRREEELKAKEEAIKRGELSEWATNPLALIASEIELASDKFDILDFDDEAEIFKADGIGSPTVFCIYSQAIIDEEDSRVAAFTKHIKEAVEEKIGGQWTFDYDVSSVTFKRLV